MSISVHSANINNSLNAYNYFFGALYNSDVHPVASSYHKRFNTTYQFSTFTTLLDFSNCSQTINHEENQTTEWLNKICIDDSGKNLAQEKMNSHSPKAGSTSKDSVNEDNNENKSKFWRPFSPPPSSQESIIEENSSQSKNFKSCNRNTFFSIKPSNVKIGLSKTSVFKAVKKNTFTCTQCSSRYLSNRQLNSHMRVHTGKFAIFLFF